MVFGMHVPLLVGHQGIKRGDGQRQTLGNLKFGGTKSSEEEQFSTASVSAGEEAGGRRAVYKGKDHEDGNGAQCMSPGLFDRFSVELGGGFPPLVLP